MTIRLTCEQLKRLYRFCGGVMDAKARNTALRFIRLEVGTESVRAYALDGYRAARMLLVPKTAEGEGTIYLPVEKIPKGAEYCDITADDGDVVLMFDEGTRFQRKKPEEPFPEVRRLDSFFEKQSEPVFSISVNPRFLAEALKAVQNGKEAVRLDFISNKSPIFLHSGDRKNPEDGELFVMPVRHR